MNSQINKEIFSDNGCIQKEMLFCYRDGNISSSDKHEVEKHLVDCMLCSEALEGFAFAGSAVALNDLNERIGQLTSPKETSGVIRYMAIAASVAAMVTLSYFAYRQFSDVKQERLAVAEMQSEQIIPQAESLHTSEPDVKVDNNQSVLNTETVIAELESAQPVKEPTSKRIENNKDIAKAMEESEKLTSADLNHAPIAVTIADETATDESIAFSATGSSTKAGYMSNVTYVDNRKVIDYTAVNEGKAVAPAVSQKHTPSKYENRKKKEEAQMDAAMTGEEVSREVNYLQLLKSPIEKYNNGLYQPAIVEFNQILQVNPDDENARFYKGMSLYHLKKYDQSVQLLLPLSKMNTNPFSEEALFYVGKSYAAKGDKEKAIQTFKSIISKSGFYKERAIEELKGL